MARFGSATGAAVCCAVLVAALAGCGSSGSQNWVAGTMTSAIVTLSTGVKGIDLSADPVTGCAGMQRAAQAVAADPRPSATKLQAPWQAVLQWSQTVATQCAQNDQTNLDGSMDQLNASLGALEGAVTSP